MGTRGNTRRRWIKRFPRKEGCGIFIEFELNLDRLCREFMVL